MNKRLSFFDETVSITDESMCLCHLDLAPRNFMIDSAGRLCLLDLATAGFYLRYFELWSIDFAQYVLGGHFGPELLQQLEATQAEMLEVAKLHSIYRYNSRCSK
jgi:Phosphotransferase enzyme family